MIVFSQCSYWIVISGLRNILDKSINAHFKGLQVKSYNFSKAHIEEYNGKVLSKVLNHCIEKAY